MSSNEYELNKIASLAYLDVSSMPYLFDDVRVIMNYVAQLREIDTSDIVPLLHPLDLHQRLRGDEAIHTSYNSELSKIAPLFEDNLYLVPKVIER